MGTAFVLGGTGQIGRAIGRRLAEAGWEVVAGSRGERPSVPRVCSVTVDRREPGALAEALGDGVDLVVDVIAFTEEDAEQLNRLAGRIGSVVAISSASVYADDLGRTLDEASDLTSFPELPVPVPETQRTVEPGDTTYSTRKVALEQALLEGPLPTTIVRPCAIHGPGGSAPRELHFVKRALDGRQIVLLADRGESLFHTTSVANLAELIRLAADQPADRVVNCGDPDPPDVLAIERAIAKELGHEWVEVLVPQNAYAAPAADTPWSTPRPFLVDMTHAEAELGYRPVIRYEAAVRETVTWLVETTEGRDWREAFPAAVEYMESSFDYEAEDSYMARLASLR
jgi:nucleoside-diphosphate-sugar epimerase